jgi:hypothetical protein
MLKTYCQKCGAPNEYVSSKPKFCNSCGNKMELTSQAKSIPPKSQLNSKIKNFQNTQQINDEDGEDVSYSYINPDDPSTFEYDPVTIQDERKVVTIGDVAKNKKITRSVKPVTVIDNDAFIRNFKTAAGPSQKPIEIIDSE